MVRKPGKFKLAAIITLLPSKLMQVLGWLNIEQLIQIEAVEAVYNALHNEAPHYIKELFNFFVKLFIESLVCPWNSDLCLINWFSLSGHNGKNYSR